LKSAGGSVGHEARTIQLGSILEAMNMPANQTTHQLTHQPTWTKERLELLKSGFEAGLSCREIAAHIGVSRNSVIGKISRMNLTRDKPGVRRPARKAAEPAYRPKAAATLRHFLLKAVPIEPEPIVEDDPIHNGHSCSLFELSKERCRWPISTPGAADFCFCGNTPIEGLPYCPGHSRLAYRVPANARAR
jgi:GcrA cell cycle regulator